MYSSIYLFISSFKSKQDDRKTWSHTSVALFYPNIIGYLRFITLVWSFVYALDKEQWVSFFYVFTVSYVLDGVDGRAARAFD